MQLSNCQPRTLPRLFFCRMGQRARRQLAEKQFGGGAKHLALPPPEAAHGPPPSAAHPGLAAAKHGRGSAPGKAQGAEAAEVLHPSWAAKRQQQGSLSVPAAGEKVVFGDDGAPASVTSAAAAAPATGSRPAGDSGAGRDKRQPGNAAQPANLQHHTVRNGRSTQRTGSAVTPARAPTAGRVDERVVRNGVRFRPEDASVTARDASVRKPAGGGGLHPSWEAKKLLRQQMERLPAPKGAKVVFQDSD